MQRWFPATEGKKGRKKGNNREKEEHLGKGKRGISGGKGNIREKEK